MNTLYKKILLTGLIIICLLAVYIFLPIKVEDSIVLSKQQVWSHANNNIAQAQMNSNLFKGIEIDVVYDEESNQLNVRHNVEDPATDVNLFQILDSTKINNCYYWIDLKNLTETNVEEITSLLNNYVTKYPTIRKNIIIESPSAKSLKFLNNHGYFTSWWMPDYPNHLISYLKFFIRTKHILLRYKFNAISAHRKMLPIINTFYSSHNIHLWTHDYNDLSLIEEIQSLFDKPNVHVLLVDYTNPNIILNK